MAPNAGALCTRKFVFQVILIFANNCRIFTFQQLAQLEMFSNQIRNTKSLRFCSLCNLQTITYCRYIGVKGIVCSLFCLHVIAYVSII